MFDRKIVFRRLRDVILILLIIAIGLGCGGGGGDEAETPSSDNVKTGRFLDSPVEGLAYYTNTQSGLTDSLGQFKYLEGELIDFAVGEVSLGQAKAKKVMTPLDLVPGAVDENDPTVTNICRFLLTLDDNADPNDGTLIIKEVRENADKEVIFSAGISEFYTSRIRLFIYALTYLTSAGKREMVSAQEAQEHLRITLGRPVADAGGDRTVQAGVKVDLDGSGSYDPYGDTLSYSWSIVSKPQGSSATLSNPKTVSPGFTPDKEGEYEIWLVVSDGSFSSYPDSIIIAAYSESANPPVADAGDDIETSVDSLVTLDGSGSYDPDSDPLDYSWTMISKPQGSTATLSNAFIINPTFKPDRAGVYEIRLVVNDGLLNSLPDTVRVTASSLLADPFLSTVSVLADYPTGLAFDYMNRLFISTAKGNILRFDGQNMTTFISQTERYVESIRFAQNNFYLLFVDFYGQGGDILDEIASYGSDGNYRLTLIDEADIDAQAIEIFSVNLWGEAYFALPDTDPNFVIARVDKNGENFTGIVSPMDGDISFVTSMVSDSKGDLYVGSFGVVSKFSRDGLFIKKIVDFDNEYGIDYADKMAIDRNDNLYVANYTEGTTNILRFDSGGVFLGEFVSHEEGGFDSVIHDMAFDSQNRLYVADFTGVYRFGQDGSFDRQGIKSF